MSKRTLEFFLLDILIAIDKIGRYCRDAVDAQAFYHDEKSFDATMRELQIVGEVTKHLIQSELLNSDKKTLIEITRDTQSDYQGETKKFLIQLYQEISKA